MTYWNGHNVVRSESVELAPADYTLPAGNLEHLMRLRTTTGRD
ncbi:MAG: hypothetical protein WCJ35_23605 [Planctomycetota bacterium]